MPCNYNEYPADWKDLTAQLREAAGHKCELCYAPNQTNVVRVQDAAQPWYEVKNMHDWPGLKVSRIVLTVHHIDGDKKNNVKHNLIVLCQRCHLRLDLYRHIQKRAAKKGRL
jgi:hypothetical protein